MIPHGIPIFVALQPVDMRLGFERLGGLVRERMEHNPRARALFAFVGKRGNTMKILTWDGSGVVLVHKKLDAGKFEIPKPTRDGEQHIVVSDAIFDVIFAGVPIEKCVRRRRRIH
jgi:transposase